MLIVAVEGYRNPGNVPEIASYRAGELTTAGMESGGANGMHFRKTGN